MGCEIFKVMQPWPLIYSFLLTPLPWAIYMLVKGFGLGTGCCIFPWLSWYGSEQHLARLWNQSECDLRSIYVICCWNTELWSGSTETIDVFGAVVLSNILIHVWFGSEM